MTCANGVLIVVNMCPEHGKIKIIFLDRLSGSVIGFWEKFTMGYPIWDVPVGIDCWMLGVGSVLLSFAGWVPFSGAEYPFAGIKICTSCVPGRCQLDSG